MGKRIGAQRKGRGSLTHRSPSHRYKTRIEYSELSKDNVTGTVTSIIHDSSKNAPVACISYGNGSKKHILAPEGIKVGSAVECGGSAPIKLGNTLPLTKIPEGTPVFNIEVRPGDGGKLARSSGNYATVISHDAEKTVVKLPSKTFKSLNPQCRATIGVPAGGDRKSKPIGKAGINWHIKRTRGKQYPRTSAVAMNPVDHKFGGSAKPGISKTTKKTASPGAKVGSFGAKRTGRRKR